MTMRPSSCQRRMSARWPSRCGARRSGGWDVVVEQGVELRGHGLSTLHERVGFHLDQHARSSSALISTMAVAGRMSRTLAGARATASHCNVGDVHARAHDVVQARTDLAQRGLDVAQRLAAWT